MAQLRIFKPLLACLICLCLSLTAFPAFSAGPKISDEDKKQPLEIKSKKMRSENEGKKIVFSGDVVSTWGDISVKSDILEVYADPDAKDKKASNNQPSQDLDKIIAIGNVRVKKGDRRLKGDRADYDNAEQTIVIVGKPKAVAWEGENSIEGEKIIYKLDEDKIEVLEGVVFVFNPKNPPTATEK